MKTKKTYFTGNRQLKYRLLTLIGLVVSDGLISQFLISNRLGSEGNPLLQNIINEGNFLVIKFLGALLCALILWDIHKTRPKVALISTSFFLVVYTGIVLWNLSIFFITQI